MTWFFSIKKSALVGQAHLLAHPTQAHRRVALLQINAASLLNLSRGQFAHPLPRLGPSHSRTRMSTFSGHNRGILESYNQPSSRFILSFKMFHRAVGSLLSRKGFASVPVLQPAKINIGEPEMSR